MVLKKFSKNFGKFFKTYVSRYLGMEQVGLMEDSV